MRFMPLTYYTSRILSNPFLSTAGLPPVDVRVMICLTLYFLYSIIMRHEILPTPYTPFRRCLRYDKLHAQQLHYLYRGAFQKHG